MATSFTDEQLSAINIRDKTLLVSAAAGAGKTATLTERIIRSITEGDAPEDISDMLIVTFTRAAAAELRERICAAIKKKLEENPEDERLTRQLHKLPGARISTIDSFLGEIVKGCAEKFGVSPSYRIADPTEASILAHGVWSSLIDSIYTEAADSNISAEDFEELCVSLVGVKTDSHLEDTLNMLYDKTRSLAEGVDFYFNVAKEYKRAASMPVEETEVGKFIMDDLRSLFDHYKSTFEYYSVEDESLTDNGKAILREEIEFIYRGANLKTYAEAKAHLSFTFKTKPKCKDPSDALDRYFSERDHLKRAIAEKREMFFFHTEKEWSEQYTALSRLIFTLANVTREFDRTFFEQKRNRSMLEYSDVERLAYNSLIENGEPTEYALSLKDQFSSVYIDEYQDVSGIQDAIFSAISKTNNRFMVGDIKQSIYSFRNAKPELFASMKDTFPIFKSNMDSDNAVIFMSKNFRCDNPIIMFTNEVFGHVFGITYEAIKYTSADDLVHGKTEDAKNPEQKVKIKIFENAESDSENDQMPSTAPEDEISSDTEWIANEISKLLRTENLRSGDPILPSDIVILLRSDQTGAKGRAISRALSKYGIEVNLPEVSSLFSIADVQLALCLLNSIDNPRRDIYLHRCIRLLRTSCSLLKNTESAKRFGNPFLNIQR